MTKEILLCGGTGGLGSLLYDYLFKATAPGDGNRFGEYEVIKMGSRDLDLSDARSITGVIQTRKPEIVINLSTISVDSLIHKMSYTDASDQLNVNCLGNATLMREFAKVSRERKYGRYIYISSVLSERPVAGAGIYSACKAFNDNLIRTAALENGKYGVTFNSIQLGYFGAGLCDRLPEIVKLDVLNRIPCKRFGKIYELANAIDFIINTEYLNGANIPLTGGIDI